MSTLRTDNLQTTDSSFTIAVADLSSLSDVSSAITGKVSATDLANTSNVALGAGLVGYNTRTVYARLQDQRMAGDFGVKGDFITDDTAAVQAAANWSAATGHAVHFPSGIYKLTSPITHKGPSHFTGDAWDSTYRITVGASRKYGTYFYLNHTGKGFTLTPTTTGVPNTNGLRYDNIATIRPQPTVAPGWVPTNHDWDFHQTGYGSSEFHNVLALNATRAFYTEHRCLYNNVRGQAFKSFIEVDNNYDTVRIMGAHQWPFWDETTVPMNYSRANLNAFTFRRSDNPMMSNCFSYSHYKGICLTNGLGGGLGPSGVTSRLKASNIDLDAGYYGVFADSPGATAQFSDVSVTGWVPTTGSIGVYSVGDAITLEFKGLRITNANDQAIFQQGNNNIIDVSKLWIESWNTGNTAKPAVSCAALSIFRSDGQVRYYKSQGNNAEILSGPGKFKVPLGCALVGSATSDASGNLVVTHGLEVIPQQIFIQTYTTTPLLYSIFDRNATTFTVRVTTPAGAAATGQTVGFAWQAEYNT